MIEIRVEERARAFAEDKDIAAQLREEVVRPVLSRGETVRLDFEGVTGATQSFIHAMISDLIHSPGLDALNKLEFANCNGEVRAIIEIVCEYSQYEVHELEA